MNDRPYIPPVRVGTMRDVAEIHFYLDIHPCPGCGSRNRGHFREDVLTSSGRLDEPGEPSFRRYDLVCPSCQYRRHFEFLVNKDRKARAPVDSGNRLSEIGGPMPSTIISPDAFVAELLRCLPNVSANFHIDDNDEEGLSVRLGNLVRSETCLVELRKFFPAGASEIPSEYFTTDAARAARAARPEHFTRAFLDEQQQRADRLRVLADADFDRRSRELAADPDRAPVKLPPLVAPLTSGSFALHRGWLERKPGGQQLEIHNKELPRRQVRTENMSRAIFEKVVLDGGDFGLTNLENADLVDVRAHGTTFDNASFAEATLLRCSLIGAAMTRTKLGDATLVECDFGNAELVWSSWYRAQVTRCSFVGARLHNAALDHATFTDCDLRGADFAVLRDDQFGTSFEATFVRCDLRGSSWLERPLYRVKFIDCKFHDVRGTPYRSATVIERPDLSEAGDGSRIGTDRDAYRAWGIDPDVPQRRYTRRSWVLSPEKRAAVVAILESRGIPFEEEVFAKTSQHAIEIRDPDDDSVNPQILAALETIMVRDRVAATPQSQHALAQQTIDDCIDSGKSFEQTIAELMKRGFSRDEAMLAMTNPLGR
jgi:uncharacterized protein YjbI with pentapeptide repeats